MNYETVIGLEVHAELKTASKLFCACSTAFGAPPNTQCCPVCMGLPGALPTWNRRAIELAVQAGILLGCRIEEVSHAARKQYFYPDLPKAYQISQGDFPLCRDGSLTVETEAGKRRVGIIRIHVEEDAGKLIHQGDKTLIDGNRCGIPLIEIVSAPDLRSATEASAYLKKLKELLVAAEISDCKMQEGSLRCDVNLSVRPMGTEEMGVRTEIKNINSFSFVEKTITYEAQRQIDALERGEPIFPQTRRYDEKSGKTVLMRIKESADDYRFLEEPDLPPLYVSKETVERLRAALPELPEEKRERLTKEFGISPEDAAILASDTALANYFEKAAALTAYPKHLAGLLLSDLMRYCQSDPFVSPVSAERLGELSTLFGDRTVNSATAKKLLVRLTKSDFSPREAVEKEGLSQIRDEGLLLSHVQAVLSENPQAVEDYQNGKKAALQALLGRLMANTGGRAEPVLAQTLLIQALGGQDTKKRED